MARYTDRWKLSILGPGDSFQADGYKFSDADRRLIDRLLAYGLEGHRHTGVAPADNTPDAGPTLTHIASGGAIPSSVRYYYRFTVTDGDGNESGPSPVTYLDMPRAVASPSAPVLAYTVGVGDLQPGGYSYALSAYKGAGSLETKAVNTAFITIAGSNPSNSVILTLPALPPGADGFNIYRRTPTGLHYLYLDSVAAPAPLDQWVDDGSVTGDCDRSLPSTNRTSNTSAVEVAFPGTIPDGASWTIYRTSDPRNWGRSFLIELVPSGATPTTPDTYEDVGSSTSVGTPPSQAQLIGAPDKIVLTDAAEVQGTLPPGLVVTPTTVTFAQAGTVTVGAGTFTWVCDYEEAEIIHCRAHLGRDSTPAATDVIADVNALRPSVGSSTWTTIFTDQADRPTVAVGEGIGATTVPAITRLERGDALAVDIDQAGGGATPTDHDLTVNILMYVRSGSTTTSQVWS